MISDQTACTCELTALDIVKYILSKLVKNQEDIGRMTKVLDCDYKLASELLVLFIDIGWIKRNTNLTYEITAKGKKLVTQ
jgi:predicted transcriptional regulator